MADIRPPLPVVPFVALLAAHPRALALARLRAAETWGPVQHEVGPFPFHHTRYYARQTGPDILRAFLGFAPVRDPAYLPAAKHRANALEAELAQTLASAASAPGDASGDPSWSRPVNFDPGYVTLAKVVLASAKDFAHRVYLADGIYAEVTLSYRGGAWRALPWTFPDYADGRYFPFFLALRKPLENPSP